MGNSRILIIYGYERIVPPFMQTIISYSKDFFDEIKYVTPPMPSHYYEVIANPKLEIITWTKWQRLKQFLWGTSSVLRPQFWQEVVKGKISTGALANIGKFYFCSHGLIDLSQHIISKNIKNGCEVFLLSTWFNVEAFAAARLRKKYPQIKAFALAHSGEVIKERNLYMHQCFHEFILENLDHTYFISKNVLRNYLADMNDIQIAQRFHNKYSALYLGSCKNSQAMNPENANEVLTILSCSRIDANKRLDRIISALKKWTGEQIEWIHIGSGILENDIRAQARELNKINPLVKVDFIGRIDNKAVIDFYSKRHVDLFINVSKSEGLPISIMEAMSYGIPCVATNVGGTSEIVNPNNGFLIEQEFSDETFINAIQSFINLPENEKSQLRINAFNTWKNLFNAEYNAKALFNDMLKTIIQHTFTS